MTELTDAFLGTLMKTQFLPTERMRLYQRGLIERLARHARAHVPFYRDNGRLDVLFTRANEIDWDRWANVPVLTRTEAQANADQLYAEIVPPECGEVVTGYTAGSTGTPLSYRSNTLLGTVGSAIMERGFMWAGLPEQLSIAWFLNDKQGGAAYPAGATYEDDIRGTRRMLHHLSVQTPVADQGRWIERLRPDVIMGYPGALALLAEELPATLADHRFLLAVCVGEVTNDDMRAAIEQKFRCPVMDLYSGSEFGPIAVEDLRLRRLLICEETVFVEFRAPADFASSDGQLEELIFTPFYNYAMPLIRYATGDFAVVDAGPPPDERTLRRLERVAGRDRNFFLLPSGQRWWPSYQNKIMRDYIEYKQIQFAQTARDRIEIRFASDQAQPVKDAEQLLAYLRAATPEPMNIALTRVSAIARRASGKYEYATREIDARSIRV